MKAVTLIITLLLTLSTRPLLAETAIPIAKIEGPMVRVYDSNNGALRRIFNLSPYKGATRTEITGDMIAITCGDGRVRLFDIKTGALRRIF